MDKSHSRGVRVHASTGYNRVEGNRRASRNDRVSDLPIEIPHVNDSQLFVSLYGGGGVQVDNAVYQLNLKTRKWAKAICQGDCPPRQRMGW